MFLAYHSDIIVSMKPCTPLSPLVLSIAHHTEPEEVIKKSLDQAETDLEAWQKEQDERLNRCLRRYKAVSFLRALVGLYPCSTRIAPIDKWKASFASPTLFWRIEPPSDEALSKSLDGS